MSVSPTTRGATAPPPPLLKELTPLAHAKIYRIPVQAGVDLGGLATLPPPYEIELGPIRVRSESETAAGIPEDEASTLVVLGKEAHAPTWTSSETLAAVEHDLFVVHWNEKHRLLFLCFTHTSSNTLYREVAEQIVRAEPGGESPPYAELSFEELKPIFHGFPPGAIINVGMHRPKIRKAEPGDDGAEAYRILAGHGLRGEPKRDTGHVVAIHANAGHTTSVGINRKSKLWGTEHLTIEGLIAWCDRVAAGLDNPQPRLPRDIASLH